VRAADFVAAAGAGQQALFAKWLNETGLPSTPMDRCIAPAICGGNSAPPSSFTARSSKPARIATRRSKWQKQFLDQFESAVRIYKDFEVDERELADHDVLFIGRPETNRPWRRWAKPLALDYDGEVFQLAGKDHSSENDALVLAAANPLNKKHMVLIAAGNSPWHCAADAQRGIRQSQYQIYDAGSRAISGFLTK